MAQQDSTDRLSGAVQLDDAYLGGQRAGGKPGRGSENKVPFVSSLRHVFYLKSWSKCLICMEVTAKDR